MGSTEGLWGGSESLLDPPRKASCLAFQQLILLLIPMQATSRVSSLKRATQTSTHKVTLFAGLLHEWLRSEPTRQLRSASTMKDPLWRAPCLHEWLRPTPNKVTQTSTHKSLFGGSLPSMKDSDQQSLGCWASSYLNHRVATCGRLHSPPTAFSLVVGTVVRSGLYFDAQLVGPRLLGQRPLQWWERCSHWDTVG